MEEYLSQLNVLMLELFGDKETAISILYIILSFVSLLLALVVIGRGRAYAPASDVKRVGKKLKEFRSRLDATSDSVSRDITSLQQDLGQLRATVSTLQGAIDYHIEQAKIAGRKPQFITPEEEARAEPRRLIGAVDELKPQPRVAPTPVLPEAKDAEEPHTASFGLKKTRRRFISRFNDIFRGKPQVDESTLEALEELMLSCDMGVATTTELIDELKEFARDNPDVSASEYLEFLRERVSILLASDAPSEILPKQQDGKPLVLLIVGINGVGKTTTIGKLAHSFHRQGAKVLLAACDTFRAAATEQLFAWAKRANVDIIVGELSDKPTTIAYKAVHQASRENYDVLIIDTAGRLHTKTNLMNELSSVVSIINREQPDAPHETILVLDGATGQNALQQARDFADRAPLTGIVVTKLDGTPKGGVVVAIKKELQIPIRYIGVGEGVSDLIPFDPQDFVSALFSTDSR